MFAILDEYFVMPSFLWLFVVSTIMDQLLIVKQEAANAAWRILCIIENIIELSHIRKRWHFSSRHIIWCMNIIILLCWRRGPEIARMIHLLTPPQTTTHRISLSPLRWTASCRQSRWSMCIIDAMITCSMGSLMLMISIFLDLARFSWPWPFLSLSRLFYHVPCIW